VENKILRLDVRNGGQKQDVRLIRHKDIFQVATCDRFLLRLMCRVKQMRRLKFSLADEFQTETGGR